MKKAFRKDCFLEIQRLNYIRWLSIDVNQLEMMLHWLTVGVIIEIKEITNLVGLMKGGLNQFDKYIYCMSIG